VDSEQENTLPAEEEGRVTGKTERSKEKKVLAGINDFRPSRTPQQQGKRKVPRP